MYKEIISVCLFGWTTEPICIKFWSGKLVQFHGNVNLMLIFNVLPWVGQKFSFQAKLGSKASMIRNFVIFLFDCFHWFTWKSSTFPLIKLTNVHNQHAVFHHITEFRKSKKMNYYLTELGLWIIISKVMFSRIETSWVKDEKFVNMFTPSQGKNSLWK